MKDQLIKQEELEKYAREFLLEKEFAEEALDGTLHGTVSSDSSFLFKMATIYFENNKLKDSFTLVEFRDKVKELVDNFVSPDAYSYDVERLD